MSTRTRTARIHTVEPLEGFVLRLGFDDGTVREIDLEAELWGPMFEPLKDPEYFAQMVVDKDAGTVVWSNGADFAPEFLYEAGERIAP